MLSKRILAVSTLTLFAVVAIFSLHASMMTDKDGTMSNCPLMHGMSSVCQMNVFEHIGTWQSLFAATIPTVILLLVVLTILLVSSLFENFKDAHFLKEGFLQYQRQSFALQLFNHLLLAFRKGILNPKIFNIVSISR